MIVVATSGRVKNTTRNIVVFETARFLRAKAECFARLCHRLGVRPSVRPSVRHTRELYQNGAS